MTRLAWADLPEQVRGGVEEILGAAVVEAVGQSGGFSPGSADRVRTASGRRAFVKAAGSAPNPRAPRVHRREIAVTRVLPPTVPAPRLLGSYDDGDWVAIVLEDVPGRSPETLWTADQAVAVRDVLAGMAAALTPPPAVAVPLDAVLAEGGSAWRQLADAPGLDPWFLARLESLADLADRGTAVSHAGDTLCHLDIRADNLLIGPDGRVTVVDWPWARPGPPWLDTLLLAVNVRLYGGMDPEALLAGSPVARAAEPDDVTAVLVGIAGAFADAARQPAPPGLPTLRAFQQAQADALLPWIRGRLGTLRP